MTALPLAALTGVDELTVTVCATFQLSAVKSKRDGLNQNGDGGGDEEGGLGDRRMGNVQCKAPSLMGGA